jgi:aminopeptidase YwaD
MHAVRWFCAVAAAAVTIAGCAARQAIEPSSPADVGSHVCYLAADALEGRLPGTPGADQAATYIQAQMEAAGLKPLFGGSYYQDFTIDLGFEIEGRPVLRIGEATLDYSVIPISGSGTVWASAVLARDLARARDSSLAGKVVFLIEDRTAEKQRWTMIGRDGLLEWMRDAAARAARLGAGAIVFVSGASGAPAENGTRQQQPDAGMPGQGFHVFAIPGKWTPAGIPCLEITYAGIQKAMAAQGLLLEESHRRLESDSSLAWAPLDGIQCEIGLTTRPRHIKVRNVGGEIRGGRNRSHYLVVGAHYDHLGFGEIASSTPWRREIHNGADDNASGVGAVLEIARQVKALGTPARSIAFVCFTAEELGAVGSAYFCEHPPYPIYKTTAMINLDTVGRLEADNLIVFGASSASELPALLARANRGSTFNLVEKKEIFGFSDQNPFCERKIPSVHIFTGAYDDYHTPDDDCDNLNFDGLAKIVEFTTGLVWELANAPAELTPTTTPEESPKEASSHGRGAYLGIVPDFTYEGAGVRIKGASPKSPAEAAGLQEGDVLLAIDGTALADLRHLMTVLSGKSPGDRITIEVLRGESSHSRTATLGVRSSD